MPAYRRDEIQYLAMSQQKSQFDERGRIERRFREMGLEITYLGRIKKDGLEYNPFETSSYDHDV